MQTNNAPLGTTPDLDEARRTVSERRQGWRPAPQDYELARDVRGAIERNEPPTSAASQALVARWKDAIDRFTGGDAAIRTALRTVIADQVNWPGPTIGQQARELFERAINA